MPAKSPQAHFANAPTLWAASLRHLLRHPAQLALALIGLSLGVATIVAVDIATSSSQRAFELSMRAVNGAATHQIVGGPDGVDEQVYVRLKTRVLPDGEPEVALAPGVEGYVSVGDRDLQLVGLDPFAAAELNGGGATAGGGLAGGGEQNPIRWLTEPGAVVMSAQTARQLGIGPDGRFTLSVGGRHYPAHLIARLTADNSGYDSLLLTDIAQAQEWLNLSGRLSRIDVRVPDGAEGSRSVETLRRELPPGLTLDEAPRRAQESLDMTAAFTTNLKAMSLLALLVSTLLIYGAISFAVVQRRRIIGILRALGATRSDVLRMVLIEASVLGVVGAGLGIAAGLAIGHELVHLVARTINDLYFVVAVTSITLPTSTIVEALLAGLGTSLVAAVLPALEAVGSTPQLGLRRSVLEERAVNLSRKLLLASGALAVIAGVIVASTTRSLFAGFAALFLLLLSVAAFTPAVLRGLARVAAAVLGRWSPLARLALGDIAASLSRTGVAVAALGMALAAMIGVSIMVESFRESLRTWLEHTLQADIYVSAPGPGAARPERQLESGLAAQLVAIPGVDQYSLSRIVNVESPSGSLPVNAVQMAAKNYQSMPLVEGSPQRAWPAFDAGGIVISQPLAWRLRLRVGDELKLTTRSGEHPFPVVGVYRAYGNDRGNMLMNLPVYRKWWGDKSVTGLSLYLEPGVKPAEAIARLRSLSHGRQSLLFISNSAIRGVSMAIFDQTFLITGVLNWLAAGVAAIGLVSSLLAWELERSRELALVRSLGMTPAGTAGLIEAQTAFMGLAAVIAAVPAGLLTALVLIDVINRRAFGWEIDLHLRGAQFVNAFVLALAAALAAGLYPAWRTARFSLASEIREE
ncbi:MAG TPA: FtsX-like permease family protein [Steroidobacteraceae bacterium]